jgi:hypothetical protein
MLAEATAVRFSKKNNSVSVKIAMHAPTTLTVSHPSGKWHQYSDPATSTTVSYCTPS